MTDQRLRLKVAPPARNYLKKIKNKEL